MTLIAPALIRESISGIASGRSPSISLPGVLKLSTTAWLTAIHSFSSCLQQSTQAMAILLLLLSLEEDRWYKTMDNPKTMRISLVTRQFLSGSEGNWSCWYQSLGPCISEWALGTSVPAKMQAVLNPTFPIRLWPQLPEEHLEWPLGC